MCSLSVASESELDTTKWYIDNVEVTTGVTEAYDSTTKTTTFVDSNVAKTDGGVYKCEYTFNVGDAMSFETTVGVHCKFIVMSLFAKIKLVKTRFSSRPL